VAPEKSLDRSKAEAMPPGGEGAAEFLDGHIRRLSENGQDQGLAGFDPARPAITAECFRKGIALHLHALPPPADARCTHPKPLTGLAV